MNKPIFNLYNHKVILASSSPRRKDLLSSLGVEYEIFSPDIDESIKKGENPKSYAIRMAEEKALTANKKFSNNIIIAADTSVFHGNRMLDKANNDEDVKKFLTYLSGKNHIVYSGVAVIFPNGKCVKKVSSTKVKFKQLTPDEINFYVDSKEGIGKAGGYAIQGIGQTFIISISGSYSGVVGLPTYELSQILKGYDGK